MLQLLRRFQSVLKNFLIFLSGFSVISKKKKKGYRADGSIFFSDFMLISKKKVLCLSSVSFLHALYDIQKQGAVIHSCLRFLTGGKTPEFEKIQYNNAEKNFALFALFFTYREHC